MDRNGRAELSALEEFCAWQGSDFGASPSYLAGLDASSCAELMKVLPGLRASHPDLTQLRRADVPLAGLTARLADWRDQVTYGRGFVLLRRLPIERMAEADIELAFAALCAHLGRARPEAHRPMARLTGPDCLSALGSGDADMTALLCLREPHAGFELKLASAVAVHNAMAAENPALLAALYRSEANAAPAFTRHDNRLFAQLDTTQAAGSGRRAQALAAALARADASALSLDFEPGDILFINDHHALFGLRAHDGAMSGGRLLRLPLESRLLAARPARDPQHGAWRAGEMGSQAAA